MNEDVLSKAEARQPAGPWDRFLPFSVLVITAATYLATVRFNFVYDDNLLILRNPFARSWRYFPQYFATPLWKPIYPAFPGDFYRPLVACWIRLAYSVFGPRPFGWHLLGLLSYLVTVWLVYLVIKTWTRQTALAWLTALIFGLHPIHHEVVAWVTGTGESLAAIAFLGAFLAYQQSRKGPKTLWRLISCALYGMALLLKETAIVLPALVFACESFGAEAGEQQRRAGLGTRFREATVAVYPYIPIALVYLVVRHRVLMGTPHPGSGVPVSVWLRTLPSILVAYLTHWISPVRLSEFYDVFYRPVLDFPHVILPILILVGVGATVWACRRRLDEKLLAFAVAWTIIPLLPALDTFGFEPEEILHDRYFFIPSVGAAFLTALIIVHLARTRVGPFGLPRHVGAAGLLLAVVLSFLGGRAASYWADGSTLFLRGYQIAPLNSKVAINLGTDFLNRGNTDAAQEVFEAGFHRHPEDPRFATSLGRVQYVRQRYPEAESYVRRAISLDPSFADAYFYLGQVQLKENRVADAQQSMRRAVELNPYSAQLHTAYGITLQLRGDCAGAEGQFKTAMELDSEDALPQTLRTIRCRPAERSTGVSATSGGPA